MVIAVKIRFSAQGAYLCYFWYLKGGGLFEKGCFFFEKQPDAQSKTLIFIKKGTITETVTVTNIQ